MYYEVLSITINCRNCWKKIQYRSKEIITQICIIIIFFFVLRRSCSLLREERTKLLSAVYMNQWFVTVLWSITSVWESTSGNKRWISLVLFSFFCVLMPHDHQHLRCRVTRNCSGKFVNEWLFPVIQVNLELKRSCS